MYLVGEHFAWNFLHLRYEKFNVYVKSYQFITLCAQHTLPLDKHLKVHVRVFKKLK